MSAGTPPALSPDISSAVPMHVGLVGVSGGDVDGRYAGAPGAQSLELVYCKQLAGDTGLNLAQFEVYP